jgi:exodeoxyribonuclease VII small subunit
MLNMLMARKKAPQNIDFEHSLTQLDKLVTLMDSGELSLEAALKSFEEGMLLARQCQQALQQAEQRVQILVSKPNESLEDWDPESE